MIFDKPNFSVSVSFQKIGLVPPWPNQTKPTIPNKNYYNIPNLTYQTKPNEQNLLSPSSAQLAGFIFSVLPNTTDRNSLKMANLAYIEGRTDLYISILVPVRFYGPPQWHMSRQHLSWLNFSISGSSQLLLTWFWPNFKGRFLGQSLTDANCCGDICPGDNCLGNICHIRKVYFFGPKISRSKLFVDSKFDESKMW